jgi:hypothetical protein
MAKRKAPSPDALIPAADYDGLLGEVVVLLQSARHTAARAVNAVMTATYWEIGRRIVEVEQRGSPQAEYGDVLIKRLAADLTARFGRGFSWRNLYLMRAFHPPMDTFCRHRLQDRLRQPSTRPRQTVRPEKEFRRHCLQNLINGRILRNCFPENPVIRVLTIIATLSQQLPRHYLGNRQDVFSVLKKKNKPATNPP